jgi:hypothetical protein
VCVCVSVSVCVFVYVCVCVCQREREVFTVKYNVYVMNECYICAVVVYYSIAAIKMIYKGVKVADIKEEFKPVQFRWRRLVHWGHQP